MQKEGKVMIQFNGRTFEWTRAPEAFHLGENRLEIITQPHTDLWQRTYYRFQRLCLNIVLIFLKSFLLVDKYF